MKCKISDYCCVYHACMSNDCQKKIVLDQGYNYGKSNCEKKAVPKMKNPPPPPDRKIK